MKHQFIHLFCFLCFHLFTFGIFTTICSEEIEKEPMEELPIDQLAEEAEPLFYLTVRDTDIQELLFVFSKESDLNIIFEPDIRGKVTVDLKGVTLNQALDAILTPLELEYRKEATFIWISKPKMETRTFILDYITVSRTGSGGLSGGVGGGAVGAGASSVTSTSSADLWTDIETQLTKFLSSSAAAGESPEKGAKLLINKMSNSITVTDFPANLEKIAKFLSVIQESVQRQVRINAKIVQVTLSDEYQSGINWSAIAEIAPMKLKGAAPGSSVFRQSLSSGAEMFQFGVSLSNFSFLLDAMSRQGKVDILSSPEIATLNNQKAIIKAGREDTFWRITTQVDPQTGQRTETASPQTITVGVVLDATPQISDDGEIIMNIHPTITERVGESVSRLGDTMSILDVRETDTVVKIKSGETIFIAGLMQNKIIKENYFVPLISRIPLIGRLFRRNRESTEKTELVIFITPTIF